MTVQHIADLEPARRTAMLVAQAASLETRLSDVTLAMFEKYMGTLFTRARGRDERRFQATRQDVAKALLLFRRTIAALRLAKESGEEGVAVVDREVGMKKLDDVLPVIGSVANVAEQDILITAAERYGVLRRFSPRFLKAFDFRSGTPNDPVLAAIELLKGMDRDSTRALPDRPPSTFLPPKWRKLIFANGKADRRLYETAVLATLRERLKGSGIWVAGSRDYRAFEDYLLPAEAVRDTGIGGENDTGPLCRRPRRDTARTLEFRCRPGVARRSRRRRNRGRQALHRQDSAGCSRRRARPGPAIERHAAARADHRGPERRQRLDRLRRPVHPSADRQSGCRYPRAPGSGPCRRHQPRPRPHGRRVARPRLSPPGQRGAMAHQRRELCRRPRRDHQRASPASDGRDLGRRDHIFLGRPIFPGSRTRRIRRFRQRQVRHPPCQG